jgi:AraC-like DNA-binding protein
LSAKLQREEMSMVAPVFLGPLIAEATRHGFSPKAWFRGLEIDALDIEAPGTVISHRDAITVLRRALRSLPIAERGLELGQRAKITERGILGLGQLASATLGDALRLGARYPQSAGYLMRVREDISADGHHLVVEAYDDDRDVQRFLVDITFSAIVALRRQLTLNHYAPREVQFIHPTPANALAYTQVFGCAVQFGCLQNAVVTSAASLDNCLPWANTMACRLSANLLAREATRFRSMSALAFSVERAIRRRLPETAHLADLAASLNLSERTLRRRLDQEGLSYRMLLDETRRSRAFDLMSAGERPLAEMAAATGFSDASAFSRAFKRWTGRPPSLIHEPMDDDRVGDAS